MNKNTPTDDALIDKTARIVCDGGRYLSYKDAATKIIKEVRQHDCDGVIEAVKGMRVWHTYTFNGDKMIFEKETKEAIRNYYGESDE